MLLAPKTCKGIKDITNQCYPFVASDSFKVNL